MSKSLCSTGLRWLWLVVVVLIIDLGSKYLILQNFALGDTVPLFPSLNLHYARNYGAAFSFLADSGGWQRARNLSSARGHPSGTGCGLAYRAGR
jgi:signal peptidase II